MLMILFWVWRPLKPFRLRCADTQCKSQIWKNFKLTLNIVDSADFLNLIHCPSVYTWNEEIATMGPLVTHNESHPAHDDRLQLKFSPWGFF